MNADPFGTAEVRDRVLAGWAAAPVRFREDANAEEELVLGGYRDRVVVELAQNAADAATRAGAPGKLLLSLRAEPPVLLAANTGAPLDPAGLESLCTLRASAKRDGVAVGRFGVGFAAVLSVTDTPALLTRDGGVAFSAAATRALVGRVAGSSPGLGAELDRRGGHVPALRLPFPVPGSADPAVGRTDAAVARADAAVDRTDAATGCTDPAALATARDLIAEGFDTVVVLPLRDQAAVAEVALRLDEVGDPLLLALPGLAEIRVEAPGREPRAVRDAVSRWHTVRRVGRHPQEVLADRPVEERSRPEWQLMWAMPVAAGTPVPRVVHAPTPTDEPMDWPALLLAAFPLDSTRRHVATGPATDALVEEAAAAYTDLLVERAAAGEDALPLVPTGLPAGRLDGAVRAALLCRLPTVPFLRPAGVPGAEAPGVASRLVRPDRAVVLGGPAGEDPALVTVLASHLAGLVPVTRSGRAALATLGVETVELADVVDALPASSREPSGWREFYAALSGVAVDPHVREALAHLPVPLADGRAARGARGLLLTSGHADEGVSGAGDPGEVAAALATLRVRAVHPEAAHPLLERLGAVAAGPRAVLDRPEVAAAVAASADDEEDGEAVAEAVLTLVAEAVAAGELDGDRSSRDVLTRLGELALVDDRGEAAPASALALPGTPAAEIFDPEEIGLVDTALVRRWGGDVLRAVGVLDGVAVLHATDVPLAEVVGGSTPSDRDDPDGPDDPAALDGWQDWVDGVLDRMDRADAQGALPPDAVITELSAVRDLDAVRDGSWSEALRLLAADPDARAAIVRPARVVAPGRSLDVPSYTAWWLRSRLAAGGAVADPDADPALCALLPAAPELLAGLDPELRTALGVVSRWEDLAVDAVPPVLDRLADASLALDLPAALAVWRRLADLVAAHPELPDLVSADSVGVDAVRVVDGAGTRVVPAEQAVVVDDPALLQRGDLDAAVVVDADRAAALADLLDLPLAGEVVAGDLDEDEHQGRPAPVPAEVRALLPQVGETWCEHDRLLVDGVEVDWWVDDTGLVHAATLDGLARGLARSAERWSTRYAVAEVLAEPSRRPAVLLDEAL